MTAAIVLAAGAATRMGQPKQLLPYRGDTLLGHAIEQARQAGFEPIVVVLGANARRVRVSISDKPVDVVENPAWERGMGSSIATGMGWLQRFPPSGSVAILLGDQPLIAADHLRTMARLSEENDTLVVAAEYGGQVGVPAIFKPAVFGHLATLPPERGARHLLRMPDLSVFRYPLPEAAVDLDTPEDFAALPSTSSEAAE